VHYEAGHAACVIISHGFFNSAQATLLLKLKDALLADYDVLMFDYRGHGKSPGVFTWASQEPADLMAVLEYGQARYRHLGLIGFSLGGAIGVVTVARNPVVESLVVVSAPRSFEDIEFKFWNLDFEEDIIYNLREGRKGKGVRPGPFWLKKRRPEEEAVRITCPVLYIHGDKDWVIDHRHSLELFERTPGRKALRIIKQGTHAEYLLRKEPQSAEFLSTVKEWFSETLTK
jgi:pimeloyl-ACP methyl ester carboxylesterase